MSNDASRTSAAAAAFHYPNFTLFQAARFLVVAGLEMQSVAVGWQVYEITRRAWDLGMVGLAQFLPGVLLFLAGGHVADRFDRRRVLLVCYAAFSLCSGLLFWFAAHGLHTVAPIYAVLVLLGIIRAFNGPAGQAFTPLLVPPEVFPNAVAWASSIFNAATIVGPSVGGVIYAWAGGAEAVYGTAAACLAVSAIMVAAVKVANAQHMSRARDLKTVLAGFQYVWRNKIVLGATTLDLFAVLLGGAVALLPVFAREILNAGPRGLGLLRSAPGIGAGTMAVVLAYLPLRRHAGHKMLWCVAAFGAFTVMFGLSRNLWLSAFCLLVVGATDMVSVIVRSTMVQLATPDEMRGRVSAVNMLFIGASNELGQFESGLTAQWMGAIPAVIFGGLGTVVIVALWARLFPVLRNADRLTVEALTIPTQQEVTTAPPEC